MLYGSEQTPKRLKAVHSHQVGKNALRESADAIAIYLAHKPSLQADCVCFVYRAKWLHVKAMVDHPSKLQSMWMEYLC